MNLDIVNFLFTQPALAFGLGLAIAIILAMVLGDIRRMLKRAATKGFDRITKFFNGSKRRGSDKGGVSFTIQETDIPDIDLLTQIAQGIAISPFIIKKKLTGVANLLSSPISLSDYAAYLLAEDRARVQDGQEAQLPWSILQSIFNTFYALERVTQLGVPFPGKSYVRRVDTGQPIFLDHSALTYLGLIPVQVARPRVALVLEGWTTSDIKWLVSKYPTAQAEFVDRAQMATVAIGPADGGGGLVRIQTVVDMMDGFDFLPYQELCDAYASGDSDLFKAFFASYNNIMALYSAQGV